MFGEGQNNAGVKKSERKSIVKFVMNNSFKPEAEDSLNHPDTASDPRTLEKCYPFENIFVMFESF